MPKRRTDDAEILESRGAEVKSRSGRVVKAKVYLDGTVPLIEGKDHEDLEPFLQETDANDLPSRPTAYARFDDDDDDLSDVSEGSYGSTRTRSARGAHLNRVDNSRPSRRTAIRPPRAPNSTHATGYGGGGVFKQAAVEILRSERRLMSTGDIARLALRRGLVRCTGKTPEATMASALYTDIKRKEGHSLFVRPREGLFGLREWVAEGVIQITSAPQQQHTTTNHHHQSHHATAAAMDSDNGTGTFAHHHQFLIDGDYQPQQPGASQDSGDRLMELLNAAEEIETVNAEGSPLSSEEGQEQEHEDGSGIGAEEKVQMPRATAAEGGVSGEEEDVEVVDEEKKEEEQNNDKEAIDTFTERYASTTFSPLVFTTSTTLKNAEIEIQNLECLHGATHPEVGLGYLNLAKMYMAGNTTMPTEMKMNFEHLFQKAEVAMNAYASLHSESLLKSNANPGGSGTTATATTAAAVPSVTLDTNMPGTAIKIKHQGFLVPAAPTAPGPVKLFNASLDKTPAAPHHGGPVAAPTPLALEETRGWNGGPFSVTTGPFVPPSALPPSSIVAPSLKVVAPSAAGKKQQAGVVMPSPAAPGGGVASDTENDADVEICLPALGKTNGGQRLPLHAVVAAPLTAT